MKIAISTIYSLKVLNAVLAATWSVCTTFILVRTLGVEGYAVAASLLATAALLLLSDFGLSAVVYHKLRSRFICSRGQRLRAAPELVLVLLLTGTTVAVATGVFYAIAPSLIPSGDSRVVWSTFFASMVSVVWVVPLTRACAALDSLLIAEWVEFSRRSLVLAICISMFAGVSLMTYSAVVLAVNFFAAGVLLFVSGRKVYISAGLHVLRRTVLHPVRDSQPSSSNAQSAWFWSALFSISEFLIYNLPYYVLGFAGYAANRIVAFDTFYKVTRFGAMSYAIGADSLLPRLTRHYHSQSRVGFRNGVILLGVVNAVPALIGSALVLFYGFELFGLLLDDHFIVTRAMRFIIVAMLLAMAIQSTAGSVLVGLGYFRQCAMRSTVILVSMFALAGIALWVHPTLELLMTGYVIVFAAGALSYMLLLISTIYRISMTGQ
jgi:O-antigen/teichoic acid export membrane protein